MPLQKVPTLSKKDVYKSQLEGRGKNFKRAARRSLFTPSPLVGEGWGEGVEFHFFAKIPRALTLDRHGHPIANRH